MTINSVLVIPLLFLAFSLVGLLIYIVECITSILILKKIDRRFILEGSQRYFYFLIILAITIVFAQILFF